MSVETSLLEAACGETGTSLDATDVLSPASSAQASCTPLQLAVVPGSWNDVHLVAVVPSAVWSGKSLDSAPTNAALATAASDKPGRPAAAPSRACASACPKAGGSLMAALLWRNAEGARTTGVGRGKLGNEEAEAGARWPASAW
mmetsp:Transcript_99571/g.321021  ORF Transcript_99571/g.321021 Transcript_99571/m.321021 type:complete len:144 (+) Transcript_99571:462-893(+)